MRLSAIILCLGVASCRPLSPRDQVPSVCIIKAVNELDRCILAPENADYLKAAEATFSQVGYEAGEFKTTLQALAQKCPYQKYVPSKAPWPLPSFTHTNFAISYPEICSNPEDVQSNPLEDAVALISTLGDDVPNRECKVYFQSEREKIGALYKTIEEKYKSVCY